jgi:hypothetical protein
MIIHGEQDTGGRNFSESINSGMAAILSTFADRDRQGRLGGLENLGWAWAWAQNCVMEGMRLRASNRCLREGAELQTWQLSS